MKMSFQELVEPATCQRELKSKTVTKKQAETTRALANTATRPSSKTPIITSFPRSHVNNAALKSTLTTITLCFPAPAMSKHTSPNSRNKRNVHPSSISTKCLTKKGSSRLTKAPLYTQSQSSKLLITLPNPVPEILHRLF